MSEHFDKITFHYVLRDENQMVDALDTLSSMLLVNKEQEITIQVWYQAKMAHCQQLDRDDIEMNGATENDKRTLGRLVAGFFLSRAILYKRSINWNLLRYVDKQEAKGIMEEVHEGTFDTHTNGHVLACKILRGSQVHPDNVRLSKRKGHPTKHQRLRCRHCALKENSYTHNKTGVGGIPCIHKACAFQS
ncbi:hypothetical protein CR513_15197, partial [Mucuna pruriens]